MGERRRYRSVVADSARWDGFEFRADDIVISTPPKCGTTWMQTICALLIFDTFDPGRPLAKVSPWLDMQLAKLDDVVTLLDGQTHRRFIKTHTPLDGLPYDDRVTYLCVGRDPRDVAVSSANHMANLDIQRFLAAREQAVGLDDLAELGMAGPPDGQRPADADPLREWIEAEGDGPMTLGATVNHLSTFWNRRDDRAVALFHYSDLLTDLPGQIRRLAGVLDLEVSDERLATLAERATFAVMKERAEQVAPNSDDGIWRNTGDFFRSGTSGQWRSAFDEANLRRYEERVAELATPELAEWMHNGWLGGAAAFPDQRRGSLGPVTPQ